MSYSKSLLAPFSKQIKSKLQTLLKKIFRQAKTYRQQISAVRVKTAVQHVLPHEYKPSQQELDVFKMKAIVLLQNSEWIRGFSVPDLLKTPICVNVNDREEKWVICLSQEIERCGQKLRLEGRFLRDPAKKSHSIPILNSFKVMKEE